MLKRKIYEKLIEWKNRRKSGSKEALLIKGARQIGKTFVINEFGKKEYDSFIEINFILNPEYKNIFNGSKEPSEIYNKLSILLPNMKLIPEKTLIFFDEIQNCGGARTALKFLVNDFRYDFIASGSLLGLEYGEDADKNVEVPDSIPVGYEYPLNMYSLDFEEFLWAKGYSNQQIDILKKHFETNEKIPQPINDRFESLFREYIVIGGMPEVVSKYIDTNDFNEAIRIQEKIIKEYQDDISKHAKGEQKIKVRACYDSIPKQLAKEYNKFQYSFVEKKQTSRKYGSSVKWLIDSNLVHVCYNVNNPTIPLKAYEIDNSFKLYINDTGLLTQMYGRETKISVLNNTIKGSAKGAIYENIIAESLIKKDYSLHFYKPDDNHELEFIIEKNGDVAPIEVKAGNTISTSLNNFIKEYSPKISYKLINGNIGLIDSKKTIPHYMIMFI